MPRKEKSQNGQTAGERDIDRIVAAFVDPWKGNESERHSRQGDAQTTAQPPKTDSDREVYERGMTGKAISVAVAPKVLRKEGLKTLVQDGRRPVHPRSQDNCDHDSKSKGDGGVDQIASSRKPLRIVDCPKIIKAEGENPTTER